MISQWRPQRTLGCVRGHADFYHQNNPGFLLETRFIILVLSSEPFDELILGCAEKGLPLKNFISNGLLWGQTRTANTEISIILLWIFFGDRWVFVLWNEYYSIATLNSSILRTAKEDQKNNNKKKGKIESNQKTKERRKKKD